MTSSSVTITWQCDDICPDFIRYREVSSQEGERGKKKDTGSSDMALIKNLAPGTRYYYWLEGVNGRFEFQTAPSGDTPFMFLVTSGDVSRSILAHYASEYPEFIVSMNPAKHSGKDWFSKVRSFLPVYDVNGQTTSYTYTERKKGRKNLEVKNWTFQWGTARFIIAGDSSFLKKQLNKVGPSYFGIITHPGGVLDPGIQGGDSAVRIKDSKIHKILSARKSGKYAGRIALAVVTGPDKMEKIDGIPYLFIGRNRSLDETPVTVKFDVAPDAVRARFLESAVEFYFKPEESLQKRACDECRRLADDGSYEQSVRAYRKFIRSNRGRYEIADAYYALGEMLDQKLFRYGEALKWYRRLVAEYPESYLAAVAKGRIEDLVRYSDYDYKPLEEFERIRRYKYSSHGDDTTAKGKYLGEVEGIIDRFPESSLVPAMSLWLAGRYSEFNAGKAEGLYKGIIKKYRDTAQGKEAYFGLADLYYSGGRYGNAIESYTMARRLLPEKKEVISEQLWRCRRNIRRDGIAAAAWLYISVIIAAGLVLLYKGSRPVLNSWSCYTFLGGTLLIVLTGYLMKDHFASFSQLMLILLGITAGTAGGYIFTSPAAEKTVSLHPVLKKNCVRFVPPVFLNFIFFWAVLYLTLFYVNEHLLVKILL